MPLSSSQTRWSEQWVGTYDGYIDKDGTELEILELTDGGVGYVYGVETEDTGWLPRTGKRNTGRATRDAL